jgi:hypothetical protein
MSLPKNPSFHSQARRKAESAAVPIHNRNVKHNIAMNHVARSPFAPPIPPKDEPPRIASAVTPVKEEDKKSLDILEKEWMLKDYLGLTPTPISEGGLAQEYLPSNIEIDGRRGSRNMIIDKSAELVDIPDSSEGTLLATQIGAETRATKRDTVAVLMDDIIGSEKKVSRRHQDVLEAAATLGDMPTPLRIPKKPENSPLYSSIPPTSKFKKLHLNKRPSLKITTTFTEPRSAPMPPNFRLGNSQNGSHLHNGRYSVVHTCITDCRKRFSGGAKAAQLRSSMPYSFRQSRPKRETTTQPLSSRTLLPQIEQRYAGIFPGHNSVHASGNVRERLLQPSQRRNTQPIIVDRMRDPDETFHELLAIHKRTTVDFKEVIAAAKTPKPENGKLGSFAKCDCTGLKSAAKSHADGLIEHFKDFRLRNRKTRRREENIEEVRRRYEEMVTANASARRGDEL